MTNTEELIRQAQAGSMEAKEELVQDNAGLIWSVVRRFMGRGTEVEDLYQLGCLGLLKAVEGFDSAFGTQFSTYAVPKISGEIRRFLRDDGAVKVSRSIKEQAFTIRNARTLLTAQFGREPTLSELSELTEYTPEEIAYAETATASTESIYAQCTEDGFTLESVLTDTQSEDVIVERISLGQAIDRLSQRESLVIKLRYLHGLTQERTAKIIGVSQVQVSRIEKKALGNLRNFMA